MTYDWIGKELGPKMILESWKLYGLKETPGTGNNPRIMQMAKVLNVADLYTADSLAWCALDMGYVIVSSGYVLPFTGWDILRAAQYVRFGNPISVGQEKFGDVLVFKRPGGHHTGLYVGEDDKCFHVLGGNQGDMHKVSRIPKARCIACCRPPYIHTPSQVRKVFLAPDGNISKNEK